MATQKKVTYREEVEVEKYLFKLKKRNPHFSKEQWRRDATKEKYETETSQSSRNSR